MNATAPAAMPATRPFYWSVRRELWENRSITIAPLVAAGVVLFGFLIATIGRAVATVDPARKAAVLAEPNSFAAGLIMATAFIVGAYYCLDALYGERRDRSILFWKSMPVSDLTTVLSKMSIPLAVLPLIAFTVALATQLIMLLLSSAIMLGNGLNPATQWTVLPLFQMTAMMLYGITVHALWFAPIYAWLLLVSSWARRAVFLWAVLPFFAIIVVERLALGTSWFASVLKYRVMGAMAEAFAAGALRQPVTQLSQLDPLKFLSSSGLWIGLAFAAACLAAAIWLRRSREPI